MLIQTKTEYDWTEISGQKKTAEANTFFFFLIFYMYMSEGTAIYYLVLCFF